MSEQLTTEPIEIYTLSVVDMHEIAQAKDIDRLGEAYVKLKTECATLINWQRGQLSKARARVDQAEQRIKALEHYLNTARDLLALLQPENT